MNWYKSARTRRGAFTYNFDDIELVNPLCFCSGTAEVEFVIHRDEGDRIDPPTVDVDLKVTVVSLFCTDADGTEIPATDEMMKEIEDMLEDDERLRERAFEHEFD